MEILEDQFSIPSSLLRRCWQRYREGRSFAIFTGYGQLATHQFAKLARERQAESGAAIFLRGAGVRLREGLEELTQLLGRHADARIAHAKGDLGSTPAPGVGSGALAGTLCRRVGRS